LTADGTEGDSKTLIETKAVERGVLAIPGTVFLPNGRKTAYVRASFSLLSEEQVDEALRRLRELVLEARGITGVTRAVNQQ
jgi:tryptophan aminotransferase